MISFSKNDWDTLFFGYPVASAQLDDPATLLADTRDALERATQSGFRLLYLFLPWMDHAVRRAILNEGVCAVGGRVHYAKAIPPFGNIDSAPPIIRCRVHSAALERLALQSGEYSRYRIDAGFRNGEFERLYREWISSSLEGKDGKCIYVAGAPDQPTGMMTLEPGLSVRIGLFAVAPEQRRQGIGRKLIAYAEQFCVRHHAQELRVATPTQNQGARRFYESCGFKQVREECIFHAWLPIRDKPNIQPD